MQILSNYFGIGDVDATVAQLLAWRVKLVSVYIKHDNIIINVFDNPALYTYLEPNLINIKNNGKIYNALLNGFIISWMQSNNTPIRSIQRMKRYEGKQVAG
jgi:hypothetical protein